MDDNSKFNFSVQTLSSQNYVGTKRVMAWPMNRADYNQYRNWDLPADENGEDDGFLVEYADGGLPNHPSHMGYISWSPKDVFENSYRGITNLTFGDAIEWMKKGHRVARIGWNGKDMWLALSGPLGGREIAFENFWSKPCSEYARSNGGSAVVLPTINMKTADGSILMGWLASQTDILAEDWMIL